MSVITAEVKIISHNYRCPLNTWSAHRHRRQPTVRALVNRWLGLNICEFSGVLMFYGSRIAFISYISTVVIKVEMRLMDDVERNTWYHQTQQNSFLLSTDFVLLRSHRNDVTSWRMTSLEKRDFTKDKDVQRYGNILEYFLNEHTQGHGKNICLNQNSEITCIHLNKTNILSKNVLLLVKDSI